MGFSERSDSALLVTSRRLASKLTTLLFSCSFLEVVALWNPWKVELTTAEGDSERDGRA